MFRPRWKMPPWRKIERQYRDEDQLVREDLRCGRVVDAGGLVAPLEGVDELGAAQRVAGDELAGDGGPFDGERQVRRCLQPPVAQVDDLLARWRLEEEVDRDARDDDRDGHDGRPSDRVLVPERNHVPPTLPVAPRNLCSCGAAQQPRTCTDPRSERGRRVVTIQVGVIARPAPVGFPRPPTLHGVHDGRCRSARSQQVQARVERRRGLRLQAQARPERGHRQGDVLDEGRAQLDAQHPAEVAPALRAAPHAQLGRRHVRDLLRRHLLLHQADRESGRRVGRRPRRHQGHVREAGHPRGRAQVPRWRHGSV